MANNKQQIDSKRYIGNDNEVIVFQQPGTDPYKCDTIISEPNHAIINVTPIKKHEALMMIKNRTEQLRMLLLMKEQKKKKNKLQLNKKLIMMEMQEQEQGLRLKDKKIYS
ncbi:MAG: hypothetical protein EZS28_037871 [Streblomastix strix]|uniref:Rap-GAP domain-containing protein n=1 Tax=Streblomastix strix TaxID=222440 RepID=A0A5J4U9N3_9EUKA|nr:MAG: hypothetical protein EZS28_037871 [Streblomastix strix]